MAIGGQGWRQGLRKREADENLHPSAIFMSVMIWKRPGLFLRCEEVKPGRERPNVIELRVRRSGRQMVC